MKNFLKISACVCFALNIGNISAQTTETIPQLADLAGDYIVANSKIYENAEYLAEVKAMQFKITDNDSIIISGLYMKTCLDIKAGFNANTGNISIPAGQKIFGYQDGEGSVQYLYAWNEDKSEVINRPIIYRYKGNNIWHTDTPIVLMTGPEGGELSPYYFSQKSTFYRSNATTENCSYVDQGSEQQKWEESRPSFVSIQGNDIMVYNMLQKDQYEYGNFINLTYDSSNNTVSSAPVVFGESTDFEYPYKMITGCEYNAETNVPTGLSFPETSVQGYIEGSINPDEGIIELKPLAIWPASYSETGQLIIDDSRFYEFVKTVRISYNLNQSTSIKAGGLLQHTPKEVARVEYYNLAGQRISQPQQNALSIKRIYYTDDTFETLKITQR